MDISSIFTVSLPGLTDIQKKAFETSIKEADVNRDNILDQKEFTEATKKFSKTDEFKSLSVENKNLFTEKLNPDAIWGQQSGVTSVINFDGNKLQTEYYEKALKEGKKGEDGKPLVTKDQLDFAKQNGFGDVNGDGKITGNELKIADINGDGKVDAQDGDINKDRKINKEDRGINLGSSETNSSNGFDPKIFAKFLEDLIKIWAPKRR
ncbi:MAG: hypothetical protein ACOYK1_01310 [Vampirovibrionia bacterium]